MTVKLNGLEIEITDGAEVNISEDGKKITIKAAQTVIENHYHYTFNNAGSLINPPYQPYHQPLAPIQYPWGVTSSVSSKDSPIGDVICQMSTHQLVMSEKEMDHMIADGRMSYTLLDNNRVEY